MHMDKLLCFHKLTLYTSEAFDLITVPAVKMDDKNV